MANKVLHDLSLLETVDQWRSVDDVAVGGSSRSQLQQLVPGGITFSGTVCCDGGEGYASIRSSTNLFDLSQYSGITLRVKGDGRRYKLSLRCATDFEGISYRVGFQTGKGVEQTIHLRWNVFAPTYHGRILAAPADLDSSQIRSLGFVVADNKPGSFRLEILRMEATMSNFRSNG